ncbi:replication initiator protein A [Helcococcus bovis]|uniref:replication initiator protein A n=1 Tax=Helcococcus bovis TaxID=3153252 RepID=UPI0038B8881A
MNNQQFGYYYGQEAEQFRFFRIPKLLFIDKTFSKLTSDAKLLYSILLDRMSLSMMNSWLDEENRVYIVFTIKEIAETMNCGIDKATKIMKELDDKEGIGLIEKKRQGLGKPNIIYVKNFVVNKNQNLEQTQKEQEFEKKHPQNVEIFKNSEKQNSRILKNRIQEFGKSESNDTNINNTNINNTNNTNYLNLNNNNLISNLSKIHSVLPKEKKFTNKTIEDGNTEGLIYITSKINLDEFKNDDEKYKAYDETLKIIAEIIDNGITVKKKRYEKEEIKKLLEDIKISDIELLLEKMSDSQNIKSIKKYLFVTLIDAIKTNRYSENTEGYSKNRKNKGMLIYHDKRMTKAERLAYVEKKLQQKIPTKRKDREIQKE